MEAKRRQSLALLGNLDIRRESYITNKRLFNRRDAIFDDQFEFSLGSESELSNSNNFPFDRVHRTARTAN